MDGYLLVNKPAGISSFSVVAQVRRIIREETGQKVKVGHTGTLDPFATGLLILVIGKYTKRAEQFSKLDKTYDAELILGKTSTTGDPEGEIEVVADMKPTKTEIRAVLDGFLGDIEQRPHRYSAVKIDGQRAYKLARQGKEVVTEPRQVTIKTIEMNEYSYPRLKITTEVSSGTYIRTLAEDIGKKLGTGAYLDYLRRVKVGNHQLEQSIAIDNININGIINNVKQIPSKII